MTDAPIPSPEFEVPRRRLSAVWLVPVLATLVALGVVWRSYSELGPVIEVRFPAAAGIEAGKTTLRYRDVEVGLVDDVSFTESLEKVSVFIRLDADMAPFVDDEAVFWIVKPEVSTRGVSGLDTVLSGVYIEGLWDSEAGEQPSVFEALERAPLALPGETGTTIVLRSRNGRQLSAGAPILFNGIDVGRIGSPELDDDGLTVTIDAFVRSPHDARLSSSTSFWDSSGISFDLGAGGVSVNVDSLAALIEGGISFGTLVSGGSAISDGHVFEVYASEETARRSALIGRNRIDIATIFDADTQGLLKGADVLYQGAKVGEVADITGFVPFGASNSEVVLLATLSVNGSRIGLAGAGGADAVSARVDEGLRSRIAVRGLLGQTVVVELLDLRDIPLPEDLPITDRPFVPATAAALTNRTDSIEGLVARVDQLPIEELLSSAIELMDSITALTTSPDTRAIPSEALELLSETRDLVSSDEISGALSDIRVATADIRSLTNTISDSAGLSSLLAALERSESIATNLEAAAADFPRLTREAAAFVEVLGALPLADLSSETTEVVSRLAEVLSDESIVEIAPALRQVVADASAALEAFEAAGVADRLGAALSEAESLLAELRVPVGQLAPILSDVSGVVADVRALPLQGLAQSADQLMQRIDTVLSAEGIETIPVTLSDALVEMRTVLAELREGGAVASLNSALEDASEAFASVSTAAEGLPALARRLDGVARQAQTLISAYDGESRLHRDLRDAIAAADDALGAIRSLARKIERNPNSLITGR